MNIFSNWLKTQSAELACVVDFQPVTQCDKCTNTRLKVLGHAAVTQQINFSNLGHVTEMVIYSPVTIRYLVCVVDREQYVELSKTHEHSGTVADKQTHPIWYLDREIFWAQSDLRFVSRSSKYVQKHSSDNFPTTFLLRQIFQSFDTVFKGHMVLLSKPKLPRSPSLPSVKPDDVVFACGLPILLPFQSIQSYMHS
jgi:hypothetical protein